VDQQNSTTYNRGVSGAKYEKQEDFILAIKRDSHKFENPIINSFDALNDLLSHFNDQVSNQVSNQVKNLISSELGDKAIQILFYLSKMPRKSKDILVELLGLSIQTKNKQRYIDPLLNQKWIELTIQENPKDRNQKYQLTKKGRMIVEIHKAN